MKNSGVVVQNIRAKVKRRSWKHGVIAVDFHFAVVAQLKLSLRVRRVRHQVAGGRELEQTALGCARKSVAVSAVAGKPVRQFFRFRRFSGRQKEVTDEGQVFPIIERVEIANIGEVKNRSPIWIQRSASPEHARSIEIVRLQPANV